MGALSIHRRRGHDARFFVHALIAVTSAITFLSSPSGIAQTLTAAPVPTVSTTDINASDQIGPTSTTFRVDEHGALTGKIALFAVPGTAGVTPKLSLSYSSQSGNGLVGQGWSIEGLSNITRCP